MYSVPPGFSKLRLPLGDFVIYPTERPSIRTLVRQIEDQGYLVQTYLDPNNSLRALPPGDRHSAVVIVDAILVIIHPFSSGHQWTQATTPHQDLRPVPLASRRSTI